MPTAASLAAKIKDAFNVDAQLIKGGGGIFDVTVDDSLIYSKFETHEFPDETQLIDRLADLKRG